MQKDISDIVTPQTIKLGIEPKKKKKILKDLIHYLCENTNDISNEKQFRQAIFEREKVMTTGIGYNVAIPHGLSDGVKNITGLLATCPEGIDYGSVDDKPVKIIILIGAKEGENRIYLSVLSSVEEIFKDEDFREKLIYAESPEKAYNLIEARE